MKELVRLAATVSGREVAITTIAMYLLQAHDRRLFKNEVGFRSQLVRRVRTLSTTSFSHWSGASDGRERRAIKELEPSGFAVTRFRISLRYCFYEKARQAT
ncbi:hypothetical protein [Bradyrhizobium sp. McL0616]|uniref:hypothetical protein n=1 Tax=Bradyrhizobium sp. McL0616 TaxID=3415674 RepID=UPI003CF9CDE3